MGLIRSLVFGRENGVRKSILRRLGQIGARPVASTRPVVPPQDQPPGETRLDLPEGFRMALRKNALAEGQIRQVIVDGVALAIAHVEGDRWFAISNDCPHAGGALGEGILRGTVVTCPQHGWGFDLSDGSCTISPDDAVRCYPVLIKDDYVGVDLRGAPA